ncbi:MAG TPA: histidine kinase dimerization/phospho-acceptor domain-containing protein, partial [Aggregatilineales bacterium]|nr:histidine kinase dimerization/phospho-acceptor domain-containing protein [Aggregatilineales bacterium]
MTIDFQPVPPDPKDSALGDQQLLKYGRDLARIYVSEKNKRKKLQLAYRTLSVIFANTPHSLVVLDRSLVIRQANSAFGRLTEMPAEETVGKPIDEVLLSETLRADLESLDSEAVSASQIEILVSKPMQRSLLLTVARLQSEQIVGWVISVDDQTAAKRADQQKREFINIAAHELRTPLTALLGYSEILTDIDTFGAQSPESQRTF